MNRNHVALYSLAMLAIFVLGACTSERRSDIPATAILSSSGDKKLTFTPDTDGNVWVYDATNDRIVYSGAVARNQSVVVDPDADQITVNGRIVLDKALHTGATHRIFFQSVSNAPAPTASPVVQ